MPPKKLSAKKQKKLAKKAAIKQVTEELNAANKLVFDAKAEKDCLAKFVVSFQSIAHFCSY